ncbi:hypothetical protein EVAR_78173_1 [Eumeta japonica]|uniref:Uncharacterized protein n=1 Tax=Eumeta variegata TaxID=151549 RepID=A0A4C1V0M6_EUMVA|nr:hypothetical protein EVAR_78173_1 [Eumeta japonica]
MKSDCVQSGSKSSPKESVTNVHTIQVKRVNKSGSIEHKRERNISVKATKLPSEAWFTLAVLCTPSPKPKYAINRTKQFAPYAAAQRTTGVALSRPRLEYY